MKTKPSHPIQYQVFSAVDGYLPKFDTLCQTILGKKDTFIRSRGAIGLILTYQKLLADALEKGYQKILILEDDINFHWNWESMLQDKMDLIDLDGNVSVIYFGANQYRYDSNQLKEIESNQGYYHLSTLNWHFTFGTYAIGFNRPFMQKLHDSLKDLSSLLHPIDVHIYWLLAKQKLIGRVLYPFLIMPDVTESDNMGERQQEEFCSTRKYHLPDYQFLSISHLRVIQSYLTKQHISLRQKMFPLWKKSSDKCSIKEIVDIWKDELSKDPIFESSFQTLLSYLANKIDQQQEISLMDLFLLLEDGKSTFCFVTPSYNNEKHIELNLGVFRNQNYPKYLYRMIYLDDQSTDKTGELVKSDGMITYWRDPRLKQKAGQAYARWLAAHHAYPDEILIFLDGDDWLANHDVLISLDQFYREKNLLVSYGSYYVWDKPELPIYDINSTNSWNGSSLQGTRQFPEKIIKEKSYRTYDWITTHLRTTKAFLFQKIKAEHFLTTDGRFFPVSTDLCEMIPLLEMAGNRHSNIKKPMMVYNKQNSLCYPTSYYRATQEHNPYNQEYRSSLLKRIRERPTYQVFNENLQTIHQRNTTVIHSFNLQTIQSITTPYFIVGESLTVNNELYELMEQTNAMMLIDTGIDMNEFNNKFYYVEMSVESLWIFFQVTANQKQDLIGKDGLYCTKQIIEWFNTDMNKEWAIAVAKTIDFN